jgi:hypothetical protein
MIGHSYYDVPSYVTGYDSRPVAYARVGAATTPTPGVISPAKYAIGVIGNGAIAAALLVPFGFKQRHLIWGSIFGLGTLFNLWLVTRK